MSGAAHAAVASRQDVIRAATDYYLRCEPIDMSILARRLQLSRATLYRRVGNHEQLLAAVIADQTAVTWSRVLAQTPPADRAGVDAVADSAAVFMEAVTRSKPLIAFLERDKAQFVSVVMGPGPVEDRSTELLMDTIVSTIRGPFSLDPHDLAQACVRVCNSFMYTHLLKCARPEIDTATGIVRMLLGAAVSSRPGGRRVTDPPAGPGGPTTLAGGVSGLLAGPR